MKKMLAALAVLLLPLAALATTTWTDEVTPNYVRSVKGASPTATGIEPAPVTSTVSTDGINLRNTEGITVIVETTTGGNMTAGGKLNAYFWNPSTGKWCPVSDGSLDLTVAAVPTQAWSGLTVTSDYGRIAWEPNGLGTSTNVYIRATKRYPVGR